MYDSPFTEREHRHAQHQIGSAKTRFRSDTGSDQGTLDDLETFRLRLSAELESTGQPTRRQYLSHWRLPFDPLAAWLVGRPFAGR